MRHQDFRAESKKFHRWNESKAMLFLTEIMASLDTHHSNYQIIIILVKLNSIVAFLSREKGRGTSTAQVSIRIPAC